MCVHIHTCTHIPSHQCLSSAEEKEALQMVHIEDRARPLGGILAPANGTLILLLVAAHSSGSGRKSVSVI